MRLIMMLFYLFIIVLGVSFAALNAMLVNVNFYFTSLTMPISVLMIVMLGLGLICGILLFLGRYWRLKIEHSKLKKHLKLTEKEIKNLRSIPLQDEH